MQRPTNPHCKAIEAMKKLRREGERERKGGALEDWNHERAKKVKVQPAASGDLTRLMASVNRPFLSIRCCTMSALKNVNRTGE